MAERDEEFAELPLDSAGTRLRRAREAAGLSLADISAQTKIAERHLASIEAGNYGALASRAYAVGFTRSYARAVGLDEHEVGAALRNELDGLDDVLDRHSSLPFEPGDPARVPGPKLAWIAALGALAVAVALFFIWRSFVSPAGSLPDLTAEQTAAPAAAATALGQATPAAQGPVVFTALAQGVWVKFYDASGAQLMQKEMALGETYTVPGRGCRADDLDGAARCVAGFGRRTGAAQACGQADYLEGCAGDRCGLAGAGAGGRAACRCRACRPAGRGEPRRSGAACQGRHGATGGAAAVTRRAGAAGGGAAAARRGGRSGRRRRRSARRSDPRAAIIHRFAIVRARQ